MTPDEYEAKVMARIDRLRARAAARASEADALSGRARDMASVIPLGQPLVGSPAAMRSQRNYRERIQATFQRAHARRDEAARLDRSADAAERNDSISSDDPSAVAKLRLKLAEIEAENELHKRVNALWRKGGAAAALAAGIDPEVVKGAERTLALATWWKVPFQVTNGAANARRVRERIAFLERTTAEPERASETHGDIVLSEDKDANRVQIRFPGKPSAATIAELRSYGFKWSPSAGVWQRQASNAAWYTGQQIAIRAAGLHTTGVEETQ